MSQIRTVPLTRSDGERKLGLNRRHRGCNKVNIEIIPYIKAGVLNHGLKLCWLFQLEERHTGRLERTEDLWLRVRKDHAPRLARLSLESRSLRDVLLHGEPFRSKPSQCCHSVLCVCVCDFRSLNQKNRMGEY